VFNLGYFRRILGNTWHDKVRNNDVLSRTGPCSHFHVNAVYAGWAMFTGWTMDASPKDLLYGEGQGSVAAPGYALRIYASVA